MFGVEVTCGDGTVVGADVAFSACIAAGAGVLGWFSKAMASEISTSAVNISTAMSAPLS